MHEQVLTVSLGLLSTGDGTLRGCTGSNLKVRFLPVPPVLSEVPEAILCSLCLSDLPSSLMMLCRSEESAFSPREKALILLSTSSISRSLSFFSAINLDTFCVKKTKNKGHGSPRAFSTINILVHGDDHQ